MPDLEAKRQQDARMLARNQFLYIKIPVLRHAHEADPYHLREDQIDRLLQDHGAGSIAGWGDSLGELLPNGTRAVAYTRIDIDVADIAAARALLHTQLPALGVPVGTQIHYSRQQNHLEDRLLEAGWLMEQPVVQQRGGTSDRFV
jgi:hypothetical protein